MTSRSEWARIQTHLVRQGVMSERRVTRKAHIRHCANCGLCVIAAIDDLGGETFVDPQALTVADEFGALMNGVRTFTLIGDELVHRSAHRIAHASADVEPAHPVHACGRRWAPSPSWRVEPMTSLPTDDEPPF